MLNNIKIYTVTEITQLIKNTLENEFVNIWLTGEISNFKIYSSGHIYFSLKDENSQINAVIFYDSAKQIKFKLEDGLKVTVHGRLSVYAKRGEYKIIVEYIEPIGIGALQIAFEQLKQKLLKEGLFDQSHKKTIPLLPQKIGVITSPDGAAIRDILSVLKRRFANVEVLIYPVRVQGDEAKYDIVQAIEYLNKHHLELDVLLVGRGGGSLEDLWPFNEEIVARAIYNSKIPVISCVGHEVDYTISDFVADLRAPTPSAAAEIVVKNKQEFIDKLNNYTKQLNNYLNFLIENFANRLNAIKSSRIFTYPFSFIEEKTQEVDDLNNDILNYIKYIFEIKTRDLKILNEKLNVLSPLAILSRGYSITYKLPLKTIVKDIKHINIDETVMVKISNGEFTSKITDIRKTNKIDFN